MAFTCPRCGRTSFHPKDEEHGYCGYCHDFTGIPKPMKEKDSGTTNSPDPLQH